MEKKRLPDSYVKKLAEREQRKARATKKTPQEQLLSNSGILLDWVGEWVNDQSVVWRHEKRAVDDLTLTGPWKIIREEAAKDPRKFRKLLENPEIRAQFTNSKFDKLPILVREGSDGTLRVLDGMNRVIAAIRDNIPNVEMYIGKRVGHSQAQVEPHVIYDFLRAYEQGRGTQEGVKQALLFLMNAYANVQELLQTRFGPNFTRNKDLKRIIEEILREKNSQGELTS